MIPVETAVELRSWGVELEVIYKFLRFAATSWMLLTGASWKWPCWKGPFFIKSEQKNSSLIGKTCGWQRLRLNHPRESADNMDTLDPKHWVQPVDSEG